MSSMMRSIKREMKQAGLGSGRVILPKCPKCGERVVRSGISANAVHCPKCGFKGRIK
jgi:predicted RNA-binding Zn-ribbon protein involved in translation (DUF1610 family)